MTHKNTLCLWYNGTAEEAANFYAKTFPDSRVNAIHRAPGDYPAGKQGDVLTVEHRWVIESRPEADFALHGLDARGVNQYPIATFIRLDQAPVWLGGLGARAHEGRVGGQLRVQVG